MADWIKGILDSNSPGASGQWQPDRADTRQLAPSARRSARPSRAVDSVNITDSARRMFAQAQAVQDAPENDVLRVDAAATGGRQWPVHHQSGPHRRPTAADGAGIWSRRISPT